MTDRPRSELRPAVARALQDRQARERGYREKALKLYPWVCGRCGRAFTRANLQELTVHHRDHNHDNNPPDGSNWELLCIYCHDNEHARHVDAPTASDTQVERKRDRGTFRPFAGLTGLLRGNREKE